MRSITLRIPSPVIGLGVAVAFTIGAKLGYSWWAFFALLALVVALVALDDWWNRSRAAILRTTEGGSDE